MKRVLVLGASKYNAKSIRNLTLAGLDVFTADMSPNAGAFGIGVGDHVVDIKDSRAVLKLAKSLKVDAIIPTNDFSVLTAARVSSQLGLRGLSENSAWVSTNKLAMRQIWSQHGLPNPNFLVVDSFEDLMIAINNLGLPVILKPAHGVGGGSRGVVVVSNIANISKDFHFATSFFPEKSILVEEFCFAISEHSVEVIVDNGSVNVLGISEKIKFDLPFRVDKAVIYPATLNEKQLEELSIIVEKVCESFQIVNGVAHIELGWTGENFVLFEAASRCGGGGIPSVIMPELCGVDQFLEYSKILLGEEINVSPKTSTESVGYFFISLPPGTISKVNFSHEYKDDSRILDFNLEEIHCGREIRPISFGGDRLGYFIISGESKESVVDYFKFLEGTIKVEYQA